jgi:FHA domain
MATVTCPAGHESATEDYCDTCGAPITAAEAPAGESPAAETPAAAPAAATCPGCGEPVAGRFCESCGYDVEAGKPAAPTPVRLSLSADRTHWERMVGSGEPAFPVVGPTLELELTGDRATLGRVRAGAPVDVDLALTGSAADPAVSHHQCIFERDPASGAWSVSDADSANGTWINDASEPLAEGAAHRLADGDRILVGAWTCLTVHLPAATAAPSPAASPEPTPEPT